MTLEAFLKMGCAVEIKETRVALAKKSHVEKSSVSVHVPTQWVILLPQEIHKIAKTATYQDRKSVV